MVNVTTMIADPDVAVSAARQRAAQNLREEQVVTIPDARHLASLDNPDAPNDAARRFLRGIEADHTNGLRIMARERRPVQENRQRRRRLFERRCRAGIDRPWLRERNGEARRLAPVRRARGRAA